jgi:hypothetical protein
MHRKRTRHLKAKKKDLHKPSTIPTLEKWNGQLSPLVEKRLGKTSETVTTLTFPLGTELYLHKLNFVLAKCAAPSQIRNRTIKGRRR